MTLQHTEGNCYELQEQMEMTKDQFTHMYYNWICGTMWRIQKWGSLNTKQKTDLW